MFKVLRYIRYDIPRGIKNIIKWTPVIWRDRDWDYYFLFVIMEFKLKQMEKLFRNYGMGLHSVRDADRMKICRLLIERINEDNYYNMYKEGKVFKFDKSPKIFEIEARQIKQDKEYLFKIMNKYILTWWD